MRRQLRCWVRTGISIAALVGTSHAADTARLEYDRDVRPILSENCFPCHGQDTKKRMAGLRLDSFEGATADRNGHAALDPGRAGSEPPLPADHRPPSLGQADAAGLHEPPTHAGADRDPQAVDRRGARRTRGTGRLLPPRRPAVPAVESSMG